MREFVSHIAVSLREDAHWEVDQYRTRNDKLGVAIWTANGYWFIKIEWAAERRPYGGWSPEVSISLSLREKLVIWWACKKMLRANQKRKNKVVLQSVIERRLGLK